MKLNPQARLKCWGCCDSRRGSVTHFDPLFLRVDLAIKPETHRAPGCPQTPWGGPERGCFLSEHVKAVLVLFFFFKNQGQTNRNGVKDFGGGSHLAPPEPLVLWLGRGRAVLRGPWGRAGTSGRVLTVWSACRKPRYPES